MCQQYGTVSSVSSARSLAVRDITRFAMCYHKKTIYSCSLCGTTMARSNIPEHASMSVKKIHGKGVKVGAYYGQIRNWHLKRGQTGLYRDCGRHLPK